MKIRFRTSLVVALLGLLFLTAALVSISSYLNIRASAESLLTQVLTQSVGRISARIQPQLEVAVDQSRLNARLLADGQLRSTEWDPLGAYLADALAAHPELSYLSLAQQATGELCTVQRTGEGRVLLRYLRTGADQRLELTDYDLQAGQRTLRRRLADMGANDPRNRPYYQAASRSPGPTWTETSLFFGEGGSADSPGVSYATPLRQPDGSLLGVLSADFDLRDLSRFLSTFRVLEHGSAFVVEYGSDGARRVIAHPNPEILIRRNAQGTPEIRALAEVPDARVARLSGLLPATYPSALAPLSILRFEVDGLPYVGAFQALAATDPRWLVCVVAPEEDVLGPVWRNNRITAALVALCLGLAALLAWALGSAIARPMHALAREALAIGRFDLDPRAGVSSRMLEVEQLARAMDEMKRGLRSFRKYVPAELVRELLASGREAGVGGERRQLTVHFSDIADFTSIAESLPPEALMALLGEYLEAMTASIVASGGTVDKYIGDAVMAFWGAPRPDAQHALHACEAALNNQRALVHLNARWEAAGRPRLEARVGIHTGEVVVGNVGSHERLNYTVIGDAVNLASRLEGLNKFYGTRLLISEATGSLVAGVMVARPLDRVSVKGKEQGVTILELLGRRSDLTAAQIDAAERHAEAFARYTRRDWPGAVAILESLAAVTPADLPVTLLLERCRRFVQAAPPADWDGIERITSK